MLQVAQYSMPVDPVRIWATIRDGSSTPALSTAVAAVDGSVTDWLDQCLDPNRCPTASPGDDGYAHPLMLRPGDDGFAGVTAGVTLVVCFRKSSAILF